LPAEVQEHLQKIQTLGDLLYDGSRVIAPEGEWVSLVQAIAAGDQRALHALYERSHRIVFTLMMRITANRETAEELTLNLYQDIWRRARDYNAASGTVLAWIMNQGRSRAIDRLRLQKQAEPRPATQSEADASADPRDVRKLNAHRAALDAALTVLTPDERLAIEATYFGGLNYDEAAARLNQPAGAIKARLRSGLHKLRHALATGMAKP
jgi:RNA polymerase sigma-70 factor (ECF subfamily)